MAIATLLYGPCFFPSDAADLADIPQAPARIPHRRLASQRCRLRVHVQTRDRLGQEDHLLNSNILYNWLAKHVSSHVSHLQLVQNFRIYNLANTVEKFSSV